MLPHYRELFSVPGAKSFAIAGFVARLPMAMVAIGLITMLSQLTGSYSLASTVAATFALTSALLAPQISRLVDRHGQGRVLPFAASISVAGMLTLLACSHWNAPTWTLFICAVFAGFMPSMPAMVRARWSVIYRGQAQLRTAYALESVIDEACFIVGPPIALSLSTAMFYQAGPLAAAILLGLGVFAFAALRRTEPPVQPKNASASGIAVLQIPSVRILALLMVALGAIGGTIDVVSVAFAAQLGRPAAAGFVVSIYALSSCCSGLLFGTMRHELPLSRLLLLLGLATALSTLPLFWASDIASLSLVMLASGLFLAPTMIINMTLIEKSVPAESLTEGMTWLITGLNIGIASGAAVAGMIVDAKGPRAGFGVAVAAGMCVLLFSLYGSYRLRPKTPRLSCP